MANEFENLKLGTEEFAKAMKESFDKWNKDFIEIGERIQKNVAEDKITFMDIADMGEEYSGVMRIDATSEWYTVVVALLENGYEVTMRFDDATETEHGLDDSDLYVVIAFNEVE